jgi:aspartate aminotransferase
LEVAYGKDFAGLKEKRVAGIQTLSGCGACYMAISFLKKYWTGNPVVYTTTPTWPIHNTLLAQQGMKNEHLPYFNPKTNRLDMEGLMATLEKAPERSIVMLHSCAHNPTGVDPTPAQWREIAKLFVKKKHYAFFDMAYQGFATGELENDNLSLKIWNEHGLDYCVAQSFAKSMGLYGQRLGTFSVVCENSADAEKVTSQLAVTARNTWSSPPKYGSDIAKTLMKDEKLRQMWIQDMREMATRIKDMRSSFVTNLKKVGSPHDWSHCTEQIGMFAFTGIKKEHCEELMNKHGVFLTMNGRISVAGLNTKNVEYVANAFDKVTRNSNLKA